MLIRMTFSEACWSLAQLDYGPPLSQGRKTPKRSREVYLPVRALTALAPIDATSPAPA